MARNDSISETLPSGTYFLKVESSSSSNTVYDLNLATVAHPSNLLNDPGNTLNTAYSLATLASNQILQDFVGNLDKADFYKFTLSKDTAFNATLSSLSGSVEISLIRDANSNGLIDGTERIRYGNGSISYNNPISTSLQAGVYFIEVTPSYSTNTAYTLTLAG